MRRRIKARYVAMNGGKLVAMMILAGLVIGVALFARAWQTSSADARICAKVDRLDRALVVIVAAGATDPKPGDYGYAYFKAHPNEAKSRGEGVKAAIRGLQKAACNPADLP